MLCEQCHRREATVHLTQVVCDVVEKVQKSNLCVECFGSANPNLIPVQSLTAAPQDNCQYCRDRPCFGSPDFLALTTGVRKTKYMCLWCSLEYHRYVQGEMGRMSPNLSQQEQLTALGSLSIETDKHMNEWVSAKDPE
jgi:hypothetical protein